MVFVFKRVLLAVMAVSLANGAPQGLVHLGSIPFGRSTLVHHAGPALHAVRTAPTQLHTVHAAPAIRTVAVHQPALQSVRTVAVQQPVQSVRTVAVPQPAVHTVVQQPVQSVRTVAVPQPAVHTVVQQPVQSVRTVAVPQPVVHTVAVQQPAVQSVRTVAVQQPAVQSVRTVAVQQPAVESVRTVAVHEEPQIIVRTEQKANPSYSFGYSVNDAVSGDSKAREESSENGVTSGSYSVADPDGRIRKVTYTADAENGFRAQVTYDGEPGPAAIPIENRQPVSVVSASPAATTTVVEADSSDDAIIIGGRTSADTSNNQQFIVQQATPQLIRLNASPLVNRNLVQLQATPFGLRTLSTATGLVQALPANAAHITHL